LLNASYSIGASQLDPAETAYSTFRDPGPNTPTTIPITVHNNGSDDWPANGIYRLSYHITNNSTGQQWDGPRTFMW